MQLKNQEKSVIKGSVNEHHKGEFIFIVISGFFVFCLVLYFVRNSLLMNITSKHFLSIHKFFLNPFSVVQDKLYFMVFFPLHVEKLPHALI